MIQRYNHRGRKYDKGSFVLIDEYWTLLAEIKANNKTYRMAQDRANNDIETLTAESSVLKTAIATIAGQKLCHEMSHPDDGDYQYAYEEMIRVARIASDSVSTRRNPQSGSEVSTISEDLVPQHKASVLSETETQQRSQNHIGCSDSENSPQEQINEDKTPLRAGATRQDCPQCGADPDHYCAHKK